MFMELKQDQSPSKHKVYFNNWHISIFVINYILVNDEQIPALCVYINFAQNLWKESCTCHNQEQQRAVLWAVRISLSNSLKIQAKIVRTHSVTAFKMKNPTILQGLQFSALCIYFSGNPSNRYWCPVVFYKHYCSGGHNWFMDLCKKRTKKCQNLFVP